MSRTFDVDYLAEGSEGYFQFKIKGKQEWTFYADELNMCLRWYHPDGDKHTYQGSGFTMCIPGEFL